MSVTEISPPVEQVVSVDPKKVFEELLTFETFTVSSGPIPTGVTLTPNQINDAFILFRQTRTRLAPLPESHLSYEYPEDVRKVEEELRTAFEILFILALSRPVAAVFFHTRSWYCGLRAELEMTSADGIALGNPTLFIKTETLNEEAAEKANQIPVGDLVVVAYAAPDPKKELAAVAVEEVAPTAEATDGSTPVKSSITVQLQCGSCQDSLIKNHIAELFVASKCLECRKLFCCRCYPGVLSTDISEWWCFAHRPILKSDVPPPAGETTNEGFETVD